MDVRLFVLAEVKVLIDGLGHDSVWFIILNIKMGSSCNHYSYKILKFSMSVVN